VSGGCDKVTGSTAAGICDNVDRHRLTRDETSSSSSSSSESRQLIDMLKCQLQQAKLMQQTTNMQLDAVKQVFTFCALYQFFLAAVPLLFIYLFCLFYYFLI